ncbi:phage major capsid protein [Nonomuraea sp. SYSU D8015]|uniref:phage major capsid protein n=1 Tax=Nonomuraea sp. SYSU D8015 TaxID=2593644 RepID=UPI001660F795|nr:hypothetical protein [Nonomuraea sp. SYSU D8015]
MPGTYPPAPPTLSGDLLTISRFLQQPTAIRRRLRTFTDLRFVSDQILTQRFRSSGGAVMYEVSEPIVNARPVESVPPGSTYPKDVPGTGTAAVAAVQKWGQAVDLTDEEIKRSVYAGDAVDRALRKVINSIIKQVDSVTISAVGSAITASGAATAAWNNATTAAILRDIELAKAAIIDLNQGYMPDTILLSSTKYAYMASDPNIANLRRRESTDNPVYTGKIDVIDDLAVVVAPLSALPSDDVWILDSKQLGGMADEAEVDPGYTVGDMAVQVGTTRLDSRDAWELRGRRLTVPVVQEPGAGRKITGT